MPQSILHAPDAIADVFASTSLVEEISFEEAISERSRAKATLAEIVTDEQPERTQTERSNVGWTKQTVTSNYSQTSQNRHETHTGWEFAGRHTAGHAPNFQSQSQDLQLWGQVSFKFAEILATWRRDELWRQVAPSWEAFVLQHVKLSPSFVNELCALADRAEAKQTGGVGELEPFIPCSVTQVAQRIHQYLQTRPDFSGLEARQHHSLDASEYVEFEMDNFRVYIWFEYVMPLNGHPHHFSRPWIGNIDFQLCGKGYGEGLYSWLNISQTDIQLRKNASASARKAWNSWAEALQQELARSFVPSGMAIAI